MTLDEIESMIESGNVCLNALWTDNVRKLLAVARAAKLVYPSDSPGQEEHELFNALSDALAALEAT